MKAQSVIVAVARRVVAVAPAWVSTVVLAVIAFVGLWDGQGWPLAIGVLVGWFVSLLACAWLADRRWWAARGVLSIVAFVGVVALLRDPDGTQLLIAAIAGSVILIAPY